MTHPDLKLPRYNILIKERGSVGDIIIAMMDADRVSTPYIWDMLDEFTCDTTLETAHKIWKYWKDTTPFIFDGPYCQIIQSPSELYRNRYEHQGGTGKGGDAKSFAIACAAIFRGLQMPYKYRFVSTNQEKDVHHVYIVAEGDIIIDCEMDEFNVECIHAKSFDITNNRLTGFIH